MRNLGPVLGDSWRLLKPYFFRSSERRLALTLLIGVGLMSVVQTELGVLTTFWSNLFYNSLQQGNQHAFMALMFTWLRLPSGWIMPGFLALALLQILIGCLALFVTEYLQIRWRKWMTGDFLQRWLADRAYYRISVTGDPEGVGTDNPDQRLSDDIASFCGAGANVRPATDTLSLALGLLSNIVSLFSYVIVLWVLSRHVALFGLHLPGGLIWVALLFSLGGTLLTYAVGRRLIALRFFQQRYEADFRFGLVRARENTEGIALQAGEHEEYGVLQKLFTAIRTNFIKLLRRMLLLNATTISYSQVAVVLPYLLVGPLFFAGRMTLGTFFQVAQVFGEVQGAFSWFADSFTTLAMWRATVGRLATFDRAVQAARNADAAGISIRTGSDGYRLQDVSLALPDGQHLGMPLSATFTPGHDTLISGPSGAGKSTLFRTLAGIWPFATGHIEGPPGSSLFLPQRPYIPLGTLRHALCYPNPEHAVAPDAVQRALEDADLAELVPELDTTDENWVMRLSGGEQQRLALARALLAQPDWLFLDEATASLDPESEGRMLAMLKRRLPGTTIVSIAHNPAVAAFFRQHLILGGEDGTLQAAD
ncbi:ABC transporter ATP-binding protein/permease [Lichenicoccus sp.]|uniref:ABC transporter ATP-binding protein/permease n=1 Tax=Lichenicoccus sp. TaxID=2781899 RepID=UPI003D1263BB